MRSCLQREEDEQSDDESQQYQAVQIGDDGLTHTAGGTAPAPIT